MRTTALFLRALRPLLAPALLLAAALPQTAGAAEPHEDLQWAIHNRLRSQSVELDFMTSRWVPALPGEELGLPALSATPHPAGDKILVAVLDTGVDKGHPDLIGKIHRNESECRALQKYQACLETSSRIQCDSIWFDLKNPEVDLDGNGYPMDCEGWSLLGGLNKAGILGRPDFGDDEGHGTHVAGIIAANPSNGLGVRGCSDRVELLPIQVIGRAPSEPVKPLSTDLEPTEGKRKKPQELSDIVARGMIYAIRSGAKVINFSMGWPESKDSEFMRALIAEAQSRGIIIVAAAGNDSTQALLRPCGYPGVICVGASGPDGALTHFSNYGSGVDVAAPGLNILSTWPTERRPLRFRSEAGYEFLHGTSQASPYVACLAAELASRGHSADETYARLVLGARPLQEPLEFLTANPHELQEAEAAPHRLREKDRGKFILSGNVDLARALAVEPQPLIVPFEKSKIPVLWDRKSALLRLPFRLWNRWAATGTRPVRITAEVVRPSPNAVRPALEQLSGATEAPWATGEIRDFEALLRITDSPDPSHSRIPSDLELRVQIKTEDQPTRVFIVRAEVIIPLNRDYAGPEARHIPLENFPRTRNSIFPVDTVLDGTDPFHDYLLIEYGQSEWTFHLLAQDRTGPALDSPYRLSGTARVAAPAPTELAREQIFARVDLDFDGKSEYVIGVMEDHSQDSEGKASPITFLYFDSAFRFTGSSRYDSELSQIPYDVNGMQVQWLKSKTRRVPSWIGYGYDPHRKLSLRDRWTAPGTLPFEETPTIRFYYLDEAGKLQALQKHEGYQIVDLLNPTGEQAREGRVPILLSKDRGHENAPSYVLDFAQAEVYEGRIVNFRSINLFEHGLPYRNLLDTFVDPALSTDSQGDRYNGTFWGGQSTLGRQRLSLLRSTDGRYADYQLGALRGQADSALLIRAAFSGPSGEAAFALTNSEIQFHDLGRGQEARTSLGRYTFFQDELTTNFQTPIVVDDSTRAGGKLPGLYTPESSKFSRGVRVVVPSYDAGGNLTELLAPAKLRYESEKECRPLDTPLWFGASQPYYFDYLCRDKLIRVPLTY
ncbi:MAG: S8 family serine peptidase [Oligoflexia bacterium]|nr:S8 family serine peptidase [Oligoflexia bacterium]